MKIIIASSLDEYMAARDLVSAYQRWLGMDLEFQGFTSELENLPMMYGPPGGAMLLAQEDGVWVGCVGLRRCSDGNAEMKRMFVRPDYQGRGIGWALTRQIITVARQMQYPAIRLDTVPRLDRAIRLYERVGFILIPPYRHNPDPDAVFMELKLT
jgi:putative acetyltransferase